MQSHGVEPIYWADTKSGLMDITISLGLSTPLTVRKAAQEWEQAFTDTIPKEACAAGLGEAPWDARLAGPNLRQHTWPFKTPSPTTIPLWFSQTPKDS